MSSAEVVTYGEVPVWLQMTAVAVAATDPGLSPLA